MYASKLVLNSNGWTSSTGLASDGIKVNNESVYGFEEWLNNPILRELKIGYIDSFRTGQNNNAFERIALFTYFNSDKNIYYVGNLYGVKQLEYSELLNIRGRLENRGWLNAIRTEFNTVFNGTNAFNLYNKCFNSHHVTGKTQTTFVCNLKYESLELFEPSNWINLTEMGRDVNNRWKHLNNLYEVFTDDEFMFK